MNVLPASRKVAILKVLVEGSSIRSIERMTGTHRDTICRLLRSVGERCQTILDEKMQGITLTEVQCDEIWGYVGKKDRNLKADDGSEVGSQFVFVAMDAPTKLIPCFQVGKRTKETALALMQDLDGRVSGRFQLTTDSFPGFRLAVGEVFGWNRIDYGQLTKNYYSGKPPVREAYGPSEFIRTRKVVICGSPDIDKISTSYIERQNLTLRMQMRRLTRLTNAFSKNLDSFKAALALHFCWYNFGRVHGTLKTTPAVAAEITGHVWKMSEISDFNN